jgi:hypothetical protein
MLLSKETSNWRTIAWLAVSLACLCFGTTAFADDDRGWKSGRHHERHDRHDYRKHSSKHARDHRHAHRKSHSRYESKHHDYRHPYAGWHYHRGRHWAPASYRGRYCTDRRHFHGVHYHVAYHDYYEYYYPRYRYYGPHTRGASLIITVPLF